MREIFFGSFIYIFNEIFFQISGIHNSIENSKQKKCLSNNSISDSSSEIDISQKACDNREDNMKEENKESKDDDDENYNTMNCITVSNSKIFNLESQEKNCQYFAKRKNTPSLTLDLKKSYEFSPSSPSWNRR